jgi:UTP-glucose-1-phosphate uridylyltransferase
VGGATGGDATAVLDHFKRTMELQELLSKGEHEAAFTTVLHVRATAKT